MSEDRRPTAAVSAAGGAAHAWTAEQALERVAVALTDLRYGSVEIVVHDGRVVQVEVREKYRAGVGQPPATDSGEGGSDRAASPDKGVK